MLRDVIESDIPIFFEQQLDPADHWFGGSDPNDREAFFERWQRILADETVTKRTIVAGGAVAGHVAQFLRDGVPEVTYWVGPEHRGCGIATAALTELLRQLDTWPIYARVALENAASLRVLAKCGFTVLRQETAYSAARRRPVTEAILRR